MSRTIVDGPVTLRGMSTTPRSKAALAADAWRSIFDFIVLTAGHRNAALARLGLTPNDSRALMTLDPEVGQSMHSLAVEWECDASTATWIIDRLESKGLAERRSHPPDRRVTLVVLTSAGVETRTEMLTATYAPPPELLELDPPELAALSDAAASLSRIRAGSTRRQALGSIVVDSRG